MFLALITVLFLPTFSQGQLHTGQLKCEYRIDPLGIDTPQPRLSWKLFSESRGEIQTAYQVLVASSREKLNESDANLWDSGKVDSRKSLNIKYRGLKLTSRQKCFWTVRVWGQQNMVSPWSENCRAGNGIFGNKGLERKLDQ